MIQLQRQPWAAKAKCLQAEPETFFPDKGGSVREAKRLCAACPVRRDCLAYALEHDERHGVWGGFSERERRKLRRAGVDADEALRTCGEHMDELLGRSA